MNLNIEDRMQIPRAARWALTMLVVAFACVFTSQAQDKAKAQDGAATVPVHMTVTVNVVGDRTMPDVSRQDVMVKQGKDRLKVTNWTPAKGDSAALSLFILIDDASDSSLGSQLDDVRAFINAQLPTTTVAVGYMSNATVRTVQEFTTDHALAAKAVRLPLGTTGAYGSPYLSLIDLMKRWKSDNTRRAVLMVTDGIDRARGGFGGRSLSTPPDADSASDVAQRTGTLVYTIYSPGIGRLRRNFWVANTAQNALAQVSGETGAESFFLGLQSPVSFKPYLDQVQKSLDNQYILEFLAKPHKKAGLQSVRISTEVPGVELAAASSVWVPAAKE
jgi:hypothetical protein